MKEQNDVNNFNIVISIENFRQHSESYSSSKVVSLDEKKLYW